MFVKDNIQVISHLPTEKAFFKDFYLPWLPSMSPLTPLAASSLYKLSKHNSC